MARPTRIPDEDAQFVQLAFEGEPCKIHSVRGTSKWRRCYKCGVMIRVEESDDGPVPDSRYF